MSAGVLVDTSFLISFVDQTRARHGVAAQYFRLALEQRVPMFLSVIVAAEFEVKQRVTDLPLKSFRILPFNMPHAVKSAELWRHLERDDGDSRAVVRDDLKLLAQANKEGIPLILTEDARTLHKYCNRLRECGALQVQSVLLADGFDPSGLRNDGQRGLNFPAVQESAPIYGEPVRLDDEYKL